MTEAQDTPHTPTPPLLSPSTRACISHFLATLSLHTFPQNIKATWKAWRQHPAEQSSVRSLLLPGLGGPASSPLGADVLQPLCLLLTYSFSLQKILAGLGVRSTRSKQERGWEWGWGVGEGPAFMFFNS